jgi:hypothetical protein
MVDVEATGDREEPRRESEAIVEAVEIAEDADERFLHHVFGDVGSSGESEHERVERFLMGPNQSLDGDGIATLGLADESPFDGLQHAGVPYGEEGREADSPQRRERRGESTRTALPTGGWGRRCSVRTGFGNPRSEDANSDQMPARVPPRRYTRATVTVQTPQVSGN